MSKFTIIIHLTQAALFIAVVAEWGLLAGAAMALASFLAGLIMVEEKIR